MNSVPLFLDSNAKIHFGFKKIASPIKLSDNVDNWQREVSSEIFKYLPFLSDYSVNVLIQRANPERGYAYGSAQVMNKAEGVESGQATPVVIPIIVVDRMLKPLDVFFTGDKAFPLNEERVREALFDPRTFELSDRKPTDQGMVDSLYPPVRTNYGAGSGVTTGAAAGGAGFGKFASLATAISSTITDDDANNFVGRLIDDPQLTAAVAINPAFTKAAAAIVSAERVSLRNTAESLVAAIEPTVVQFTKLADGNFKVKWANAEAFSPQEQNFTPAEAQQMSGTESVQQMQPDQSVTMGTSSANPPLDTPHVVQIQEFGQYQVRVEETGQDSMGWVLPVVNFDQNPMGLMLFTNGEGYSLQDEMVGSRVGDDISQIPLGEPHGDGVFFYAKSDGTAVALPPVTIQNSVTDPEGNSGYLCQTPFGEQITLHLTPSLEAIHKISDSEYAIPQDMLFSPLGSALHIAKSLYNDAKVKEARALPNRGFIKGTGVDEFHLSGQPFSKLASEIVSWLDSKQAEFLLVAAGLEQASAREKLAEAGRGRRTIEVDGLNHITPLDHVHNDMTKKASEMLKEFPYHLRKDLIKIAATLEDTETADNILSLNFLNPENISIFASYLPQLNDTSQKLAEMLTASRMGLKQLDEGALERAMLNLEEVIRGLKGLQQRELL
jgi:hypothetical protein